MMKRLKQPVWTVGVSVGLAVVAGCTRSVAPVSPTALAPPPPGTAAHTNRPEAAAVASPLPPTVLPCGPDQIAIYEGERLSGCVEVPSQPEIESESEQSQELPVAASVTVANHTTEPVLEPEQTDEPQPIASLTDTPRPPELEQKQMAQDTKTADIVHKKIELIRNQLESGSTDVSSLSDSLLRVQPGGEIELAFHAVGPVTRAEEAALTNLGAVIVMSTAAWEPSQLPANFGLIQAWIPYDRVGEAAQFPWVAAIAPPNYGQTD